MLVHFPPHFLNNGQPLYGGQIIWSQGVLIMRFHCIHINKKVWYSYFSLILSVLIMRFHCIHINKKVWYSYFSLILIKRSPTMRVEDTYMESSTGTFHRDCVLASFCECRRHYSSWGVSRESQSSPLRFFVESNATDHQEVSSFFSDKNPKNPSLVDFERATWSLEVVSPANRLP